MKFRWSIFHLILFSEFSDILFQALLVISSTDKFDKVHRNPSLLNCLNISFSNIHYPTDATLHYETLLNATSRFRNLAFPFLGKHLGIENQFIMKYVNKPLSFFNGFIPIFIQFVDIEFNDWTTKYPEFPKLRDVKWTLKKILRTDVVYLILSQNDHGVHFLQNNFPNILTLSGGGYGHVPIPLLGYERQYIPATNTLPFPFDIGFSGSFKTSKSRGHMVHRLSDILPQYNMTFRFSNSGFHGSNYLEFIANTTFNLAPRGIGRTSFRLSEIIQIGRIPVYVHHDDPWIPYNGSDVDYHSIGYMSHFDDLDELVQRLSKISISEIQSKLEKIKAARVYYTYEGFFEEIDEFIRDPMGPTGNT